MKRWFLALVALWLLAPGGLAAWGGTAEKIIARHRRAVGGARALLKITSTVVEGEVVNAATGDRGTFVEQRKTPDCLAVEMIWSGQRTTWAYNGRSAWQLDPAGGPRTLTGAEAARLAAAALDRNDRLLHLKKNQTRARWTGRDQVEGRPADVVELTTRAGLKRRIYFDSQSTLVLREERDGAGGVEQTFFGDYRSVDGVKEPFRIDLRLGAETLQVTLHRIRHNVALADSVFDFPKRSDAPLPDVVALLKDVERNQKQLDVLLESYTYTDTETETEIEKSGAIKEKSVKVYEVFFLGGRMVRKLARKDGRGLSPDEQQQEEARVDKRVREFQKRRRKETARQSRQDALGEGDEADQDEKSRNVGIASFLRVARFINPRRERFRGEDVIVFDFEPNPDYLARNRLEKLLQSLVGVAWVDEQAKQVARLEARIGSSFRLAGGLLSVERGSAFVLEQQKVNKEVWLPSYGEGHLSAKAFFIAGLHFNVIHHYSDYKKFRVESVAKPRAPAAD